MAKRPKPIVLTVLDGWGYRAETKGNAIALARKPHYDRLLADYPNTLIQTSEPAVGLPAGQMGNSEVGHLNIGAGRIASLVGRYYAMDRDNRWERVQRAYRAVVHGESELRASDPIEAVRQSYEAGVTDEFAAPVVLTAGAAPAAPPHACIR